MKWIDMKDNMPPVGKWVMLRFLGMARWDGTFWELLNGGNATDPIYWRELRRDPLSIIQSIMDRARNENKKKTRKYLEYIHNKIKILGWSESVDNTLFVVYEVYTKLLKLNYTDCVYVLMDIDMMYALDTPVKLKILRKQLWLDKMKAEDKYLRLREIYKKEVSE